LLSLFVAVQGQFSCLFEMMEPSSAVRHVGSIQYSWSKQVYLETIVSPNKLNRLYVYEQKTTYEYDDSACTGTPLTATMPKFFETNNDVEVSVVASNGFPVTLFKDGRSYNFNDCVAVEELSLIPPLECTPEGATILEKRAIEQTCKDTSCTSCTSNNCTGCCSACGDNFFVNSGSTCSGCTTCAAGTYPYNACNGVHDVQCAQCNGVPNCNVTATCITNLGDNTCTSCTPPYTLVKTYAEDDVCYSPNLCLTQGCPTGNCEWDTSLGNTRICLCGAMQSIHGGPYTSSITLSGSTPFNTCGPELNQLSDIAADLALYPNSLQNYVLQVTNVVFTVGQSTDNTLQVTLQFSDGQHQDNLLSQIEEITAEWIGNQATIIPDSGTGLNSYVITGELLLGAPPPSLTGGSLAVSGLLLFVCLLIQLLK